MIRPRGGDFIFDDDEFAIMRADIEAAKAAGADGVVLGVLNAEGDIESPGADLRAPLQSGGIEHWSSVGVIQNLTD